MAFDYSKIKYVPILSVRPAEMIALRELPSAAKDLTLPHVLFRPWLGGGTLVRAREKVLHAVGGRPFTLELDLTYDPVDTPVSAEFETIRVDNDGLDNWVAFVAETEKAIPCIQVTADPEKLITQIDRLNQLQRGVAVRFPRSGFGAVNSVAGLLNSMNVLGPIIVLDFEQTSHRYLTDVLSAKNLVSDVRARCPSAWISISSTSFPSSFKDISCQEIFEKTFFNAVLEESDDVSRLIYSDRGSARMPRDGGGGVPAPRIDVPTINEWHFHRSELEPTATKAERLRAYKEMAEEAIRSESWDRRLNIWGTQMIKLTELGSEYGITSPVKSTAARINIHLFKQATRLSSVSVSSLTEEDWVDL